VRGAVVGQLGEVDRGDHGGADGGGQLLDGAQRAAGADQEDRPPAQPGDVGADQEARDDRAERGRRAEHRAKRGERARLQVRSEHVRHIQAGR